jgi:ParB-like chromosome segregation protein Spo0J
MQRKSELRVEFRPISEITPYEGNPRVIPQSAVEKVAASIRQFGWQQPIVVDKAGVIVAGHTRRLAALHLGLKAVPVHVADDLSPDQIAAYRLADNRVADETR